MEGRRYLINDRRTRLARRVTVTETGYGDSNRTGYGQGYSRVTVVTVTVTETLESLEARLGQTQSRKKRGPRKKNSFGYCHRNPGAERERGAKSLGIHGLEDGAAGGWAVWK